MVEIHGRCEAGFEPVRDRFRKNFETRDEVGASVCVTLEGETVVDLWAGHRDAARTVALEERALRLECRHPSAELVHRAEGEGPEPGGVVPQAPGLQQRGMGVDAHAQRAVLLHRADRQDES